MDNYEEVGIDDVAVGMYVSRLDRPWLGTPYPLQGFHIRSDEDINTLSLYCKKVYVDPVKSNGLISAKDDINPVNLASIFSETTQDDQANAATTVSKKLLIKHHVYDNLNKPVQKELKEAKQLHYDLSCSVIDVMNKIRKNEHVDLSVMNQASKKMVGSIIRNPDAFTWLYRLKAKDPYIYSHSIRSSIWAVILGRYIGIGQQTLETLSLGVLLSNIGKIKLPSNLLHKPGPLTGEEYKRIQEHINHAVAVLENTPSISSDVISIVEAHCEHFDGSGYPNNLCGDEIPLLARIAGLVDFYDAITNPRSYAKTMTSTEAVDVLHAEKNRFFQGELVDEFIQAIGMYPTGTLVELNTKEVAIVTSQEMDKRLRPQVMLLLDKNKKPFKKNQVIDLYKTSKTVNGESISIIRGLPVGSYDIDPGLISDKNLMERPLWKRFPY